MLVLSDVGLWAGFWKRSIECQLYFWILKSYQHGTRIGGERDSYNSLDNAAEEFCMHLHACVCAQTRPLFKDFRDVLYRLCNWVEFNNILKNRIQNKKDTVACFIHFRKDFDTVNRKYLLAKLEESYGMSGRFLHDYRY